MILMFKGGREKKKKQLYTAQSIAQKILAHKTKHLGKSKKESAIYKIKYIYSKGLKFIITPNLVYQKNWNFNSSNNQFSMKRH